MLKLKDKSNCCGCTACESICKFGAISMVPDPQGFVYPQLDESKCVDCGLCEKVCVFNKGSLSKSCIYPVVYAARHKFEKEVVNSRSGAVFVALSDAVLEEGGVIYGAAFTNDFMVAHKRALTSIDRDSFRGSKYVQSDLTGIFTQVENDLRSHKSVLFSGTPCQVAGLKSYLELKKVDLTKLFLIDVVCHGVPSPVYWKDYVSYIEKKENRRIIEANFRDKQKYGWSSHVESFVFSSGKKKSYKHKFYHDIMLRRSCSVCPYANITRPSDITLGDFWGWERLGISINDDNKGLNLVLINSEKGNLLFKQIKENLNISPADISECLQPNLLAPTNKHPLKDSFEQDYVSRGFEYVGKKYTDLGWRWKWMILKSRIKGLMTND